MPRDNVFDVLTAAETELLNSRRSVVVLLVLLVVT